MLITCRECQGQVSDQAERCPHCGIPLKTKSKKRGWLSLLGWAVVVVLVLLIASLGLLQNAVSQWYLPQLTMKQKLVSYGYNRRYVEGTVHNKGDKTIWKATVKAQYIGQGGEVAFTETTDIGNLAPGQSKRFMIPHNVDNDYASYNVFVVDTSIRLKWW